ncbi:MAG TPA: hypothetical protein VFL83_14545 [Anaeromyxobacter sp.]|nr:hypothetical protein [Anaeromyxobacter sp.]
MASAPIVPIAALALLLPAAALAHGAGGHPPDPALHVDPSLDDCSIQFAPELTQGAFRRFVREFGSVGAFKQGAPPTTLGRRGVSVDVEYVSFEVEEKSDAWNDTFAHPDAYHELGSRLAFPKLRVRFGVTDDVDVGAFYAQNPAANYGWVGVEARYGLLQQRDGMPVSVAVRGAYTKTLYVGDMDMHAAGVDVSVGRTFWSVFTPYVGFGGDAVAARETSGAVDLDPEALFVPHATGGFEVRYWHLAIGAEAQIAEINTFQAQVSVVF